MANKKSSAKTSEAPKSDTKRVYFRQSDFPQITLQEAQRIPAALINDFGGKERGPHRISR